MEKYNKG